MITSSVYYTTDPHAAANDLRELLPDATIGIYWHESIPIVTIEQPGREQKTFLQPRHRLVTHDGGKTLITEPVLSDQEKYRQLQSRITRLEREVREERAEGDDVRERLRAVIACRVWNDDLGRGFVFADDLRHAVDPELYPEPMPVRLDVANLMPPGSVS